MDNKGGVNNNIQTNSAYSNVVKQPLLEEDVTGNSPESAHKDNSEPTITVPLNYTPTRTLS
jgi:hypothetical protein